MSLEPEQIIKNAQKYFDTANKIGFMTDELTTFLGQDFIKAPASTAENLHNAFEGGLIDHLLRVTSYAIKFNNTLPEKDKVNQDSLMKVCFLHQIGKAKLYVPNESEWHRKNLGKMYNFNDALTSMSVSDRSVLYAVSNGVTFTDEEYQAIIFFDREDNKMAEYHNSILGDLLKMANLFAIKAEKIK